MRGRRRVAVLAEGFPRARHDVRVGVDLLGRADHSVDLPERAVWSSCCTGGQQNQRQIEDLMRTYLDGEFAEEQMAAHPALVLERIGG